MREAFSTQLVELVKADPKVYLLSGDHGYALFDLLRKEKPAHFVNAGVAEQNMIGVGAGMSKTGLYPVMYGLSAFVPMRVLEQIKIDFCYEKLPGLFIGDGAGVVYSHLGTSHQCTEDLAVLRSLPHISILSPCDAHEFRACFNWAVKQKSPVYLRMGKADLGAVHQNELPQLDFSPLPVLKGDHTAALFATGSMVKVCQELIGKHNLKLNLYSVPVIKAPTKIDYKNTLAQYKKVITVEEHSIFGGLGDMLAADAAELGTVKLKKIGIEDRFSEKCGTYQYLMQEHGLDEASIYKKITDWLG